MSRGRVVGEYQVGRQVGSGSFSVVWHGRHRVHGTEVAIKEIATTRLNKKLRESLMSEIVILKNINHPNIIRLHDIIEVPGKIHLVLEYCKGGDLSMFIQRHGRVPEATAKHFMKQLASGLQVLRDNNLIHRDLKPQNLLLSTTENKSVLKIADFGFARSLQPRGLAETLCGSPLYMAPEIMQLQKYDAKADLWSVGTILFQLVVGKTPFTGNNQIQLLQNIIKSTELHFPHDTSNLTPECKDLCHKLLRRNPVERLTFEEFFNHPFLFSTFPEETFRTRKILSVNESNSLAEGNMPRSIEEGCDDDCLPFFLDDDSNCRDESPSYMGRKSSVRPSYGFSPDTKSREATSNISRKVVSSTYGVSLHKAEQSAFQIDKNRLPEENLKDPLGFIVQKPEVGRTRGIVDSLELEDQDYVFVSGPSMDVSSSVGTSKPTQSQCISESPPASIKADVKSSSPMEIVGSTVFKGCTNSLESHGSPPGTSQGSMGMGDVLEHPSSSCMTRIKSLYQCASAIRDLIAEKIEMGKQLEAFSVQLVSLAIWKQALHICHTQAASAMELGSPAKGTINKMEGAHMKHYHGNELESLDNTQSVEHIEREFLLEVERAEELSKAIESGDVEMPDAIETIYQSALALGRHGAVDELMGNAENAELLYSKSVELFRFLLVEAPSLILNPPFSLTNADRYRLRTYIDIVGGRRGQSRSQRMALLTSESQACLL